MWERKQPLLEGTAKAAMAMAKSPILVKTRSQKGEVEDREYFVDDKQWIPEDTLERSQELSKDRTRKVKEKCPGIGMQEMKANLESGAYYHDTQVINLHGVSMTDEMVRLWLLKESMQWGLFRSTESPQTSFSFLPILTVMLGEQLI